ncbi:MAG: glycerol-3-phosphate dehydrogenase [Alphaproteobacteria bacterium]|nr:glycerol-3-phosphate dehydrogenase [Alphaproteobacteria bacterium]
MTRIVIIGAGAMGAASAMPALDNGHEVTLVGSPLDDAIIEVMNADRRHPQLDRPLAGALTCLRQDELAVDHLRGAEIVVLGVSVAGIPWALGYLLGFGVPIGRLMMITSGLDATEDGGVRTLPSRFLETLALLGAPPAVIAIGGPCIARELSNRAPTAVVYGYRDRAAVEFCRKAFETDYYHIRPSADLIGVAVSTPLAKFLAIGISASWSRIPDPADDNAWQMNPTAALFEQAMHELALLTRWLGGNPMTAIRLAGAGDLFATVNVGRNAELGRCLRAGDRVSEAFEGPLMGEMALGVETAQALGPALYKTWQRDPVLAAEMPLTRALLNALLHGEPLTLGMGAYWHRDD